MGFLETVDLSIYLVDLSIYLSIYLSVYLSIYLPSGTELDPILLLGGLNTELTEP